MESREKREQRSNSRHRLALVGGAIAIALSGCSNLTIDQYEATAKTTYTWQVRYAVDLNHKSPRFETFASTSLINRNGIKPIGAVAGPDDRGLWWAALPPRPTVDEVEQRKGSGEQASTPELIKTVDYQFIYPQGDRQVALPTNYQVYRQVIKARPTRTPLKLTLGITNKSVEKVEPLR